MGEKRKEKRKINRLQIRFGKETLDRRAFTSNLSLEGFFVRTSRAYDPETILHFEFQLPGNKKALVDGQVMHASRYSSQFAMLQKNGMGIQVQGDLKDYIDLLKSLKIIE